MNFVRRWIGLVGGILLFTVDSMLCAFVNFGTFYCSNRDKLFFPILVSLCDLILYFSCCYMSLRRAQVLT